MNGNRNGSRLRQWCKNSALAGVALVSFAASVVPAQAVTRKAESVDPARPSSVTTSETIDLDAFAQGIEDRLEGHVVGYSYGIGRNGALMRASGGGFRRLPQDGMWALPFDENTMTQAASTSKTITAAALLKALHDKGIEVDTPVEPYLPSCWDRPAAGTDEAIDSITFRDVLGHHSRLLPAAGSSCTSDPLQCLRDMVAQGRVGTASTDYSNHGYALVRVILPFVLAPEELQEAFEADECLETGGYLNQVVSERFRDYIYEEVLGPVGASARFYPPGEGVGNYALMYNNADWSQEGIGPKQDFYLRAGAGYLAIGAASYARFLSALDAGLILPKQVVEEMKGQSSDRMGFDSTVSGTLGDYVWKNGGCPGTDGIDCAAYAMIFPNGVQVFAAVSSGNNSYDGSLKTILRDAFDDALL